MPMPFKQKDATNVAWRQQKREFPYPKNLDVMLASPKYIKDRQELFRDNGNGWWWEPKQGQALAWNNRSRL